MNTWEKLTAAITFAEAGEADYAREIMGSSSKEQRKSVQVEDQQEIRNELRL